MQTLVTFLLDRTGSMATIKADTIGGFNAYLDTLESECGDSIGFTLIQFDSKSIDRLYTGATLQSVARLTDATYQPRAYTPLIQAVTLAIDAVSEQLAGRADIPKVILVVQSDGEENASPAEYTLGNLRKLIAQKRADGWEIVYMGANIDAYDTGRKLGFGVENTMSYRGELSEEAFAASAQNTILYAKGMTRAMGFSGDQKMASGDSYDSALRERRRLMALTPATGAAKSRAKPRINNLPDSIASQTVGSSH